eukprot:UN27616
MKVEMELLNNEVRALTKRLEFMKLDVTDFVNDMLKTISAKTEIEPTQFFGEDWVDTVLEEIFINFSKDSKELDWESFYTCFATLGLRGEEEELKEVLNFQNKLTLSKFKQFIKEERLPEFVLRTCISELSENIEDLTKTNRSEMSSRSTITMLHDLRNIIQNIQDTRGITSTSNEDELFELYKALQAVFETCD